MELEDLVVEVRDRSLRRQGQIDARYLGGSVFSPRPNDVGTWSVTLPESVDGETFEAAMVLREPGSGIIVTGPHGVILSGPTIVPEGEADADTPEGTWTISGVTDTVLLQDALAVPDPASDDPTTSGEANDIRVGTPEDLLREYVSLNICNGAIAHVPTTWARPHRLRGFRQMLRLHDPVSLHRGGAAVTRSPRYTGLLELCQSIVSGTDLLFEVRQIGDLLELVVWEAADLSASIRMDIDNDQLTSTRYAYSPPSVTEPYVAGQGEGPDRTIVVRQSAAAADAEEAWGRPIEVFIDQRQTDDIAELQQKGDATLAEALAATRSLTVVPSDDLAAAYGLDWTAGDTMTVVIGDEEVPARLAQAVIAVTDQGVLVGAVIGGIDDLEAQTTRAIGSLVSRVSSIERNGQVPKRLLHTGHGTTAERDALFGVPGTASARAALANACPVWFNIDRGWEESYYATTGTVGLTARGLTASAAAGWYPVGPGGPRMYLVPHAQQSLSTGAYFINWAAPGSGRSYRNCATSFLDLATGGVPTLGIAGRYAVTSRMVVQSGAGTGALYLTHNSTTGALGHVLDQDTVILSSSHVTMFKLQMPELYAGANESVRLYAGSVGSAVFALGANPTIAAAGFFNIEYLGPPLVNH